MSKPGFEDFKYWLRGNVVNYAMSSKTNVEIGRDGTGEDIPVEVVGRSIGSN